MWLSILIRIFGAAGNCCGVLNRHTRAISPTDETQKSRCLKARDGHRRARLVAVGTAASTVFLGPSRSSPRHQSEHKQDEEYDEEYVKRRVPLGARRR